MADTWDIETTDSAAAISGMADVLDQAADVTTGLSQDATMGGGPQGESEPMGDDIVLDATTAIDVTGGPAAEGGVPLGNQPFGPSAGATMGGGPSTDTMPQSIYGTPGGTPPNVTDLGDKPSLQALQSAVDSVGGGPAMGGGPSDLIDLMGDEEVAEEVSPGIQAAEFLSDFNKAMGGGPQDIRDVMQPGAQWTGGPVPEGPYVQEAWQRQGPTHFADQPVVEETIPGSLRNRAIRSHMGGGPSDVHEAPIGSYDYQAGRINEPVPKSTMERLYAGITNLGGSEMGAGGPDIPGVLRHDAGYEVFRDPHSTAMGTPNQAYLEAQAGPDIPGVTSFAGTPVDQVAVSGGAVAPQNIAPQQTGATVTVETQEQMYPGHNKFAAMAGVNNPFAMMTGSRAAWIDAINKDMVARGIELDHEINGVKTGKHSSGNWKEYSALFDPETGLDSNGVAMPGTGQAPVEEVAVKPNLPDLSFLPPNFEDITPEIRARMERVVNEWRLSQQQAGQANANQAATVGDDTRGDNPVDIIRSTYTWATSLPNSVLFNAARYPDYLRLLIEYDAAGKDLPLTVPTWILEGTARPAEDEEEQTSLFANHPSMQTQELVWT